MENPASDPTPVRSSPWRDLVRERETQIAIVLLFLATIPLLTKIFTSDFGTHIAIGRQIVQTRSIPDKEFLNYPSLGIDSPNPVWLFQALLYLVFAAGGPVGVSFLCWAVVFGVLYFIYRSCLLRGANPILAVVAIFAFSGFLRIRIQPRPEIFTYLFISLTIFLFSEFFYGKRKRLIYAFPALLLVWANSHPTYLMAFLLCGIFTADYLARAAWNRELAWESMKMWVLPPFIVGVAGLVVCGLNPNGYESILAPIQTITRGAVGGGSSSIMMSISELTPVKGTGFYVYYKAAIVFAAFSLALGTAGKRLYLLDLFLFAIAFKGAYDSARAVSMMGLFLSPGASLHVTGFLDRVKEWTSRRAVAIPGKAAGREKGRRKGKGKGKSDKGRQAPRESAPARSSRPFPWWKTAGALIVAAFLLFGGRTLSFSFSQLEYGIGLTEHKFSLAAGEFLRKNPIPGNMFNFFDIGGFLDWQVYPQVLTFTDGRTYNQQVFMEHQIVTGAMDGWKEVLEKYDVNYIVIKSMDSSGMVLPVVGALANDSGWSLVFADGLFLIFVRNTQENMEYIRKHEVSKSLIPQHIIWESYHYMFLGVPPIVAYQTMSNMYMMMGNRKAAIESLRKAIDFSDEPFLRARLMQLEQGGTVGPPGHP
jgi:hypothetical protein